MKSLSRWGRKLSFLTEIDLRALALFRVAFGILCIADIFRRAPRLTLLYTNGGVWSNHMAIYVQDGFPPFSLLYAFSTLGEVSIFFSLYGISLFFFTIGYKTRLFQVISLVGMISIFNRNHFVAYGGDSLIIVLHFLTILLPLGRVFSVDSYREKKLLSSPQTSEGYPCARSVLCGVIFIQFSILYLFSAWEKSGVTWLSGSAMHYFLHLDKSITPFGLYLRDYLHPVTSLFLTWGALIIEWGAAFLIISPFATNSCRRTAICSLCLLHVGIALVQSIAIFQLLMTASLILLIPAKDITLLAPKVRKNSELKDMTIFKRFMTMSREVIGIATLFIVLTLALYQNFRTRRIYEVPVPSWVSKFAFYTGFREAWGFFSPDVGIGDTKLIIDLKLKNGSRIDPQTGKEPSFEPLRPNEMDWDQLWHNYTEALALRKSKFQIIELERWMASRRRGLKVDPKIPVESYEATIITDLSPPPGSAWNEAPMVRKREIIITSKKD